VKKVPPPVAIPQPPAPPPGLAADVVASGLPVHPEDRVRLFSADQWERFVQEWVDSLRDEYELVERCGGAGDMGRDVIATVKGGKGAWDLDAGLTTRGDLREHFHDARVEFYSAEGPDAGESTFPQDIKKHFWESVKTSFTDAQVIIIENSHQLPGDGTLDGVKVELFTRNDQGRRGFIPVEGEES